MASIPFVVPAFNPASRGVALDWNEKIHFGHGGQKLQKALWHESLVANGRPDIDAVVVFFERVWTVVGNRLILNWGLLCVNRMGGTEWSIWSIVISSENLEYAIHGR